LVLEDIHWADEATLDVLSLLARRIEPIPALIIATYRDDELGRTHPLKMLLGEFRNTRSTRRLKVEALSLDAVAALALPFGVDGEALYRATSGNSFFVTEALAQASGGIPATVRDAVLARVARLDTAATTLLEAVAIAPAQTELWLLDALVPGGVDALEQCLSSGMLEAVPNAVAFRHELARIAVEESLPPNRRAALHRRALRALEAPPSGSADLARLAHHAEAAGDTAAVVKFAPAAAEHAAGIGAHREAAAQFARALRFADDLPADIRATLLERRSYECYLTDLSDDAVTSLQRAIECRRELGDTLGEGAALSSLSRRLWCSGRIEEAESVGWKALRLLENLPPGRELGLVYSNLSQLSMNAEDFDATVLWGTRALELAEKLGDSAIVAHSLNNIGTMQLLAGMPAGLEKLERSLALAESANLEEHLGRVFVNVGLAITRTRAYQFAPWLDRGVDYCADRGLERWGIYVVAYRARFLLDRGNWDEAANEATFVLQASQSARLTRILALTVLGLVRARRGDPEQWAPLDEALALAEGEDVLQFT
ncbi:MAG: helix-turn-helix transcriptional regulator, partial [Planctomycetota bacterium]